MDYHGQPLQFISSHFFQAKKLYYGIYPGIISLLYTITQFSLIGVPFIGYLSIKYIHPKIYNYMEWYSKYLTQNCKLPQFYANLILFFSFVISNLLTTIALIIAHIFSAMKFSDYGREVLGNITPYIHLSISSFAILTMFAVTVAILLVYIHEITMSFLIATLTSLNIIYISSYYGPFMFLALVHVPLLIITFIFTSVVTVIIWCLLTYSFISFVTSEVLVPSWCSWNTYAFSICFALTIWLLKIGLIIFIFLYAVVLIAIIVIHSFFLGSYNNSPSLEAVVIAILVALIGTVVFKSYYKKFEQLTEEK